MALDGCKDWTQCPCKQQVGSPGSKLKVLVKIVSMRVPSKISMEQEEGISGDGVHVGNK